MQPSRIDIRQEAKMLTRVSAVIALSLCLGKAFPAFAQQDPGVRGGFENTAGELERRGIPIDHPPLLSPNPATGATVSVNEEISFLEGINRAGQLESTCDTCADVPDGSPVIGKGEL